MKEILIIILLASMTIAQESIPVMTFTDRGNIQSYCMKGESCYPKNEMLQVPTTIILRNLLVLILGLGFIVYMIYRGITWSGLHKYNPGLKIHS